MGYSEAEKFMYVRAWNHVILNYIINLINTILYLIILSIIGIAATLIVSYDYSEPFVIITEIYLVGIGFICIITIKYNYDIVKISNILRKMCEE